MSAPASNLLQRLTGWFGGVSTKAGQISSVVGTKFEDARKIGVSKFGALQTGVTGSSSSMNMAPNIRS